MKLWHYPTINTYRRIERWHQWWKRWHLRQSRRHESMAWSAQFCAKEMATEVLAEIRRSEPVATRLPDHNQGQRS